ncbi:hypothetical protein [Salinibacter sp. 10B]|uniref:hypothetical protein n=1 Tax=Salinibacter sp. 10B TaxID=1923971 RepID=UPI0011B06F18|nr:hypothetical protein [Salinibacter sp. 10B]
MHDFRRSLLARPVTERREVLAKQAKEMSEHYNATREERTSWQSGRIYDYDSEETPPSSENSEEPKGKGGGQSDDLKEVD